MLLESDNVLKLLYDHKMIEKSAFILAEANDKNGDLYDNCMCDDVEISYYFGSWRGLAEHKRRREQMITSMTFTQHLLSNPIIEVEGDTAKARYSVFATHGVKQPDGTQAIFYGGAVYYHALVRISEGWRIKRHHCETLWYDDPSGCAPDFAELANATVR